MAKQLNNLIKSMSTKRSHRIETKKQELLKEIDLQKLRQAFELTQKQLADTLKVKQAAISKMENQSDMYISTLRKYIRAMGGKLKIVAKFPNYEMEIDQFDEVSTDSEATNHQIER